MEANYRGFFINGKPASLAEFREVAMRVDEATLRALAARLRAKAGEA